MVDHTNIDEKIRLRRQLDKRGAIWVPFCGTGELAASAEYPAANIRACDIDAERAAQFADSHPGATVEICPAESYPFTSSDEFTAFDIDAYVSPFPALEHGLKNCRPVLFDGNLTVVLTDGTRQHRQRKRQKYDWLQHSFYAANSPLDVASQESTWTATVIGFIGRCGWNVIDHEIVNSGWMRYWSLWLDLKK